MIYLELASVFDKFPFLITTEWSELISFPDTNFF